MNVHVSLVSSCLLKLSDGVVRAAIRGVAIVSLFASFNATAQLAAANRLSLEKGTIDIAVTSNATMLLDESWQNDTLQLGATPVPGEIRGAQQIWRLQVDSGLASQASRLESHFPDQVNFRILDVAPAAMVSVALDANTVSDSLRKVASSIELSGGKKLTYSRIDAASILSLSEGSGEAYPASTMPWAMHGNTSNRAPKSFVMNLAGDTIFAVPRTSSQSLSGETTVVADIVGSKFGSIELLIAGLDVSGIARAEYMTYLLVGDAAGNSVSASFDNQVPDHPAPTATDTAAPVVAGGPAASLGNRCTESFSDIFSLDPVPLDPEEFITVSVLFVAEKSFAAIPLNKVRILVNRVNAALAAERLPVRIRSVGEERLDYAPGCGEDEKCWYDMCDALVRGVSGLEAAHDLRKQRKADVVVLLINNTHNKGLAADIGTSKERAFIVLSATGLVEDSLAHELTHLTGGLHNRECHPGSSMPRHGYLRKDGLEATIMATSCSAFPFNGFRSIMWSSSGSKFRDGSDAGDPSCCKDAQVFVSGAARIASFY